MLSENKNYPKFELLTYKVEQLQKTTEKVELLTYKVEQLQKTTETLVTTSNELEKTVANNQTLRRDLDKLVLEHKALDRKMARIEEAGLRISATTSAICMILGAVGGILLPLAINLLPLSSATPPSSSSQSSHVVPSQMP